MKLVRHVNQIIIYKTINVIDILKIIYLIAKNINNMISAYYAKENIILLQNLNVNKIKKLNFVNFIIGKLSIQLNVFLVLMIII